MDVLLYVLCFICLVSGLCFTVGSVYGCPLFLWFVVYSSREFADLFTDQLIYGLCFMVYGLCFIAEEGLVYGLILMVC